MHVEVLFQELKVWPTLTPGDHKQFHLCAWGLQAIQDDIWAIVLQGEMTTAQSENAEVGFFNPINFSLNSKPLTYILFSV